MKVLFGWELGGNYGHVAGFAPAARELVRRGHDVTMVLRQVKAARGLVDDLPVRILGAPAVYGIPKTGPMRTWTDTLRLIGTHDPDGLEMTLVAWRALVDLVDPDVIVSDSAPSMLLATAGGERPVVHHDSPWGAASRSHPQPAIGVTARGLSAEDRLRIDADALAVLNEVNRRLGLPALREVREIYRGKAKLILAFRELDPLAHEHDGEHLGNSWVADRGAVYPWPPGDGPRVFAYLRTNPRLPDQLAALAACRCRAVVVWPDGPPAFPELPPHVHLHRAPARIDALLGDADLAMTASATGTGAAFLIAGVPLVLVPNYEEQGAVAECVAALGAGVVAHPGRAPAVDEALAEALSNPRYRRGAQTFAAAHQGFDPAQVGARSADAIERAATS